jgi:hypothetical protein
VDPATLTMLGGSFLSGLGKGLGQGSPAGPSSAFSPANTNSWLDGSGWTVATNGARATADHSPGLPWLVIIGGAVAALLIWKKA